MDITIWLAKIWGPVIFAVGLGIFTSRSYYVRIYRDLEKDALGVLVFGMVAMSAGIAQILSHNIWGTLAEGVVSFLGWGLFVKGLLFVVAPNLVDRTANFWARKGLVGIAGTLTLIVGAYLLWVGY